jgi:hypothetical protein
MNEALVRDQLLRARKYLDDLVLTRLSRAQVQQLNAARAHLQTIALELEKERGR